jgi:dTDP-glucose pyrophosphorylase
MTHDEIETYRERLAEIIREIDKSKANDATLNKLRQLALDVGASVVEFVMTSSGPQWHQATASELVHNVHEALQTASMIDACRTAAKDHEVAVKAQESARLSQWVSIGAMLAAVAGAIAVWIWH